MILWLVLPNTFVLYLLHIFNGQFCVWVKALSNVTTILKVADREDVFPSESWFNDEDCDLLMENWNWQRCRLNVVTDKVKRLKEQPGTRKCLFYHEVLCMKYFLIGKVTGLSGVQYGLHAVITFVYLLLLLLLLLYHGKYLEFGNNAREIIPKFTRHHLITHTY